MANPSGHTTIPLPLRLPLAENSFKVLVGMPRVISDVPMFGMCPHLVEIREGFVSKQQNGSDADDREQPKHCSHLGGGDVFLPAA